MKENIVCFNVLTYTFALKFGGLTIEWWKKKVQLILNWFKQVYMSHVLHHNKILKFLTITSLGLDVGKMTYLLV